jgi:hypothetical protein
MVATDKLRGVIAERGLSQRKVAEHLGMTGKTFYTKMKKGVFDSDEMSEMISFLNIPNPGEIFFAEVGTHGVPTAEKPAV